MECVPFDIIIYLADLFLELRDIIRLRGIGTEWNKILSRTLWPTHLYKINFLNENFFQQNLQTNKFRRVDLSDTMITDDFAKFLTHCTDVVVRQCFYLTDEFVIGLDNCTRLDVTKCINIKGTFLETKPKWDYLNLNGCLGFNKDYTEKIIKMNDKSEIVYDKLHSEKFDQVISPPTYRDIFRGYDRLTYTKTKNIMSTYVDERTRFLKVLTDSDENKFANISGRAFHSGLCIFQNIFYFRSNVGIKTSYNGLFIENLTSEEFLYDTNDNCYEWGPNYSEEKNGLRLDQYIDELKTDPFNLSRSKIDNLYIQISPSNNYDSHAAFIHDEDFIRENPTINTFIERLMKLHNYTDSREKYFKLNDKLNTEKHLSLLEERIKQNQSLDKEFKSRPKKFFEEEPVKSYKSVAELLEEKIAENKSLDKEFEAILKSNGIII